MRAADHVVVRGSYHQKLLEKKGIRATFIPDGVNLPEFSAAKGDEIRKQLAIGSQITIGVVGSCVWNERLQMCYGWDLVELLRILRDEPVSGILIGDGSGIEHLRHKCREYGIESKMHFVGRIAYEHLPDWLGAMDICLSTQTNDLPGQVRTTGKLPIYLAAGRYVLASRVGEAANVLPDEMLVEYRGVRDEGYPERLADRVRLLLQNPARLCRETECRDIAASHFDYVRLYRKLNDLLNNLVTKHP